MRKRKITATRHAWSVSSLGIDWGVCEPERKWDGDEPDRGKDALADSLPKRPGCVVDHGRPDGYAKAHDEKKIARSQEIEPKNRRLGYG